METVVYVLDRDGTARVEPWGWAATERFRGRFDGAPNDMARRIGGELGCTFDVHAVVTVDDRKAIVLRVRGFYSLGAGNEAPWSIEILTGIGSPKPPRLSFPVQKRRRSSASRLRRR